MLTKLLQGFKGLFKPSEEEWDFTDRRKLVRLKCRFGVTVHGEGEPYPAEVLDMGVLGLGLRCGRPLATDAAFLLALVTPLDGVPSEPLQCKVVWSRPPDSSFVTYAGAVYCSDPDDMRRSWVNTVLHELGFTKNSIYSKRRFVRADCVLPGQVFRQSSPGPTPMKCSNLGVGGALLEHAESMAMGEEIRLTIGPYRNLPLFQASGQVVRINSEAGVFGHGVDFDDLSPPKVKLLGHYLRALLSLDERG